MQLAWDSYCKERRLRASSFVNYVDSYVAVTLQAENLEHPWGDCGEKEMKYYDKYVHSRCIRECETSTVLSKCHCRDAYMPGHTEGNFINGI